VRTARRAAACRKRADQPPGPPIPIYSIYGFSLESAAELPGLTVAAAETAAELRVWLDDAPRWAPTSFDSLQVRYRTPAAEWAVTDNLVVYELPAGFALRYADGCLFHVARNGCDIWARWPPHYTLLDTEPYLLGPVIGFALRLRGGLCLHASAVVVDGRAVALLGPSQAGKSTTAAAFGAAGFPVLADDLVAVGDIDGVPMAYPGAGKLRLWEDSERMLFGRFGDLPRHAPSWDKATLALDAHGVEHVERAVPLGAVVVLGEREDGPDAPRISAIRGADAFAVIVANSYANYLLDGSMRAMEFAQVARLVSRCPVRRVTPSTDPARLGALVSAIVASMRAP
jgi:hypothetical protein